MEGVKQIDLTTHIVYPDNYVQWLHNDYHYDTKFLNKLKRRVDYLLKNRDFDDVLVPFPMYLKMFMYYGKELKEDVPTIEIVGNLHNTYKDFGTWSGCFINLQRLPQRTDGLFHPANINKIYLTDECTKHDHFYLVYYNGKYFVEAGMHRATIAKFAKVKILKQVSVYRVTFWVEPKLLKFVFDQDCILKWTPEKRWQLLEKIYGDGKIIEKEIVQAMTKDEINLTVNEIREKIMPDNLNISKYYQDKANEKRRAEYEALPLSEKIHIWLFDRKAIPKK